MGLAPEPSHAAEEDVDEELIKSTKRLRYDGLYKWESEGRNSACSDPPDKDTHGSPKEGTEIAQILPITTPTNCAARSEP